MPSLSLALFFFNHIEFRTLCFVKLMHEKFIVKYLWWTSRTNLAVSETFSRIIASSLGFWFNRRAWTRATTSAKNTKKFMNIKAFEDLTKTFDFILHKWMQVRIFLGTFDDFPVDKTIQVLNNNSIFPNKIYLTARMYSIFI